MDETVCEDVDWIQLAQNAVAGSSDHVFGELHRLWSSSLCTLLQPPASLTTKTQWLIRNKRL